MAKIFKQLFCRHSFEKVGFHEEMTPDRSLRYSVRHYRCPKCGKSKMVDGRFDI